MKLEKKNVLLILAVIIFALVTVTATYAFFTASADNTNLESFKRVTGTGANIVYAGNKLNAGGLVPGMSKEDTFTVKYIPSSNPENDLDYEYTLDYICDNNGFKEKDANATNQFYAQITEVTTGGKGTDEVIFANEWEKNPETGAKGKDVTGIITDSSERITKKTLITSGATHTYTLVLTFNETEELQDIFQNTTYQAHIGIDNVKMATGDSSENVPEPVSFASDSWKTIAANVKAGNTDVYNVGAVKCVPLDGFTHTGDNGNGCTASNEFAVRIANKDACPAGLDSETACGFVLEFADIITNHNMNPAGELDGTQYNNGWNIGGWPASSMYSYINEVDGNSSSGTIFKALPSELQEVIIPTHVVSGHGSDDRNAARTDGNWESDDMLYLLSPVEVYGNNPAPGSTTDNVVSRQLKYYAGGYELNGEETSQITTSNNGSSNKNTPVKKKNSYVGYWWMRSANSDYSYRFRGVIKYGTYYNDYANTSNGVAPAFRIG